MSDQPKREDCASLTDDLIARLREEAHCEDEYESTKEALTMAADALEAQKKRIHELEKEDRRIEEYFALLRARIAALEAALKPFADMTNFLDEPDDGNTCGYAISCDDLRAARAAMDGK